MKLVLNRSPFGAKLSRAAIEELVVAKRKVIGRLDPGADAIALSVTLEIGLSRADSDLIAVVERLGADASVEGSEFVVVEIPGGPWKIGDVCGIEYVKCGEGYYPKRSLENC